MFVTTIVAVDVLLGLAIVFYGFAKTGCKRVKFIANWKNGLQFEIERAEPSPYEDRAESAAIERAHEKATGSAPDS